MDSWTEYQVQCRYDPEQCPGADHSWTDEGSPRQSYANAASQMEAWAARDEYKNFRIVRKLCTIM